MEVAQDYVRNGTGATKKAGGASEHRYAQRISAVAHLLFAEHFLRSAAEMQLGSAVMDKLHGCATLKQKVRERVRRHTRAHARAHTEAVAAIMSRETGRLVKHAFNSTAQTPLKEHMYMYCANY